MFIEYIKLEDCGEIMFKLANQTVSRYGVTISLESTIDELVRFVNVKQEEKPIMLETAYHLLTVPLWYFNQVVVPGNAIFLSDEDEVEPISEKKIGQDPIWISKNEIRLPDGSKLLRDKSSFKEIGIFLKRFNRDGMLYDTDLIDIVEFFEDPTIFDN